MIRTFIDSGVLIQSVRGEESLSNKALEILADTNREFASSIFLKIEILPKAIYNKQSREVKFYQEYFDSVTYWAMDINQIILEDITPVCFPPSQRQLSCYCDHSIYKI